MATLKTNPTTNDLEVANNSLIIINGADEVTQRVRARLKLWRGEWFLNLNRGTPYREIIFAKGTSPDTIASAIKREILTTSGVVELLKYSQEIDAVTRKMTIDTSFSAEDGTIIELSEEI
jgi:hypothetical protein